MNHLYKEISNKQTNISLLWVPSRDWNYQIVKNLQVGKLWMMAQHATWVLIFPSVASEYPHFLVLKMIYIHFEEFCHHYAFKNDDVSLGLPMFNRVLEWSSPTAPCHVNNYLSMYIVEDVHFRATMCVRYVLWVFSNLCYQEFLLKTKVFVLGNGHKHGRAVGEHKLEWLWICLRLFEFYGQACLWHCTLSNWRDEW